MPETASGPAPSESVATMVTEVKLVLSLSVTVPCG